MAEKLTDTDVFYMEQAPEVIANKTGANVNDVFFAEQAPNKLAKTLEVSEDSVFHYKQAPNLLANEYAGGDTPTPVTLVSIAVTTPPTKTTYAIGEALDLTGLVVEGTYKGGTKRNLTITMANISGFDSSSATANQTVTITVGKLTTTFKVTINA